AIVDGCSQWGAFFRAALPLVEGGLAATAFFVFILNWSDLLIPLVLTQGSRAHGHRLHAGPEHEGGLALRPPGRTRRDPAGAAARIGTAIRRYLVRGLTFGAIRQ